MRAYNRETPTTTSTRPLWNRLYLESLLIISIYHYRGQDNRTRGKARRAHDRALLPNLPNPETSLNTPSTTDTLQRKGPCCAAPFSAAVCRWRNVFLAFSEMHSPCSSFSIGNFDKKMLLRANGRVGGRYLPKTIKKTVIVVLVVLRGGISPYPRMMIMVVNIQGGAGDASSMVAAAVGEKTSRSAQEVVARFGPALLHIRPSALRSPAGSQIDQGIDPWGGRRT